MFPHFYAISHGQGQFVHYFDGSTSSDNKEAVFTNLAANSSLLFNTRNEAEYVLERCQILRPDIEFFINTYNT